ncbi:unnamed protein product [Bursaphelenchus xylophilus]|uniref:(pine wood nematode) hypothetical protein n=1 Tax=Bursaphelenchus xylophilus TaxID=6326 RepID=A0A1I7SUX9_BURXY|nr:unnamed protein product [Bursaphelenchus xylophilus]CAG9125767.1 unnamed protein product [Bursaphelenchus xylophilus]
MENFTVLTNPNESVWECVADTITKTEGTAVAIADYSCWKKGFGDDLTLTVLKDKSTGDFVCSLATVTYCMSRNSKTREPITAVGMFYTSEKYRGKGIGTKVFGSMLSLERFAGHNMTLLAAEHMAPKYASKFGFSNEPPFTWKTYAVTADRISTKRLMRHREVHILPWTNVEFAKIDSFDKTIATDIVRTDYLKASLEIPEALTLVALGKSEAVTGIIRGRQCVQNQLYVGPFYADSPAIAESLLKEFFENFTSIASVSRILISAPSDNEDFTRLWSKMLNSNVEDAGILMPGQFTKTPPKIPTDRIYGVFEYSMSYV